MIEDLLVVVFIIAAVFFIEIANERYCRQVHQLLISGGLITLCLLISDQFVRQSAIVDFFYYPFAGGCLLAILFLIRQYLNYQLSKVIKKYENQQK